MKESNYNILTIDCEDFLSLPVFKNFNLAINWDYLIDQQIELVLETLYKVNDTKATFFIVGEIARRNPQLIKKIESRGHHIGSHSNKHSQIYKFTKAEFNKELKKSIYNIENAIDKKVDCYRAPIWSYKKSMSWFWDVLRQNNIKYDSSIFPISKRCFGNPDAERFIHQDKSGIFEIPPSTIRVFGANLPFSGGIYFRFIPYFILKIIIKLISKKGNQPISMYFHPWELDPNLIKIKNISSLYKFVLYYNTKTSLIKLEKLLEDFKFTSIEGYFQSKLIK